jgi:N-acetylneuraminate synthase
MIIDRNVSKYAVASDASITEALTQISKNRKGFVLCLSSAGHMDGVLTDGDFRRWISSTESIELDQPVIAICNRQAVVERDNASPDALLSRFDGRIRFLPLVDAHSKVTAVCLADEAASFEIAGRRIGPDEPSFIIAEIGINHNGSVEIAKKLVDCAVEAGADCAKFQMRDLQTLYRNNGKSDDASADLGAQYTLEVLERSNLTADEMGEVLDYAKSKGIIPLCTPWDLRSVAYLAAWGMEGFKIASADLTNHQLLRAVAATGKPMIISTGMSRENEILESVGELRRAGAQFALLHCNSTYPAPFKDVHLRYMDRLAKIAGAIVGYSGHERGYAVPIAAVARGACIIEKHITLDRGMQGNDHKVSLEPGEFKDMVAAIRDVEAALGTASARQPSVGELMNREILAKSLIATCDITEGSKIDSSMISITSPGKGLQPNRMNDLVGRLANRNIQAGDFFYETDLSEGAAQARDFKFSRPWGIPVRYHDWKQLHQDIPMDFLEFHLSYKDIEADIDRFFDKPVPGGLVVHSPDLFANDHILNLAADDDEYREISIGHLQSAIDAARRLRKWFPNAGKIPLVASLGGMSRDEPVARERIPELYQRVIDSLSRIDAEGVEILPQTLPPFPWYLGGQLHCNLFVDPEDTAEFAEMAKLRICFDISHSKLAANHRGRPFDEYVEILAPITGHLHIVDAAGVDSEGLQIGEGELDFAKLGKDFARLCPGVSFIPEIWQGHKNGGEGFWTALTRLEGLL